MDSFFVFAVICIVLFCIGSGIWAAARLIAWTVRSTKGTSDVSDSLRCPHCGNISLMDGRCRLCGWMRLEPKPVQQGGDDWQITARQIGKLCELGLLDVQTFNSIMVAINQVKGQAPATAPRAVDKPAKVEAARPAVSLPPIPSIAPPPLPPLYKDVAPVRAIPIERPAVEPVAPKRVVPVEAKPKPPRKSVAELLGAFMEESNIRWGELIGGLLIVGCSIALVFTFWGWIEARPWFKFFLFTGATAGVFGVALYTEHRWKLPNTSRGLLLIAALLVPLNFLAIVAFSRGIGATAPVRITGEVVAAGLFVWLVWLAGRVLVGSSAGWMALGVVGGSVSQLVVNRLAGPVEEMSAWRVIMLMAMPIGVYCGTVAGALLRLVKKGLGEKEAQSREGVEAGHAIALLTLLGVVTFATLPPVGLLGYVVGSWGWVMQRTAPLLSLAGVPALATGLLLWRRLTDSKLAGLRTAGTSVGVAGAMILLGGLAMAWPNPAGLLPVAVVDFAVLTAVAILFEIPLAHLAAGPCLVLAYLLGMGLVLPAGHPASLSWIAEGRQVANAMMSAESGLALTAMVALLGTMSQLWRRWGQRLAAWCYGGMAGAVACASLALLAWHGLGRQDDHGLTWVLAAYAAGAYAAAVWVGKNYGQWFGTVMSWAGSALLAGAMVQGLAYHWPVCDTTVTSWAVAMLVHASVMALGAGAVQSLIAGRTPFEQPLSYAALATSTLAGLLLASGGMPDAHSGPAGMLSVRLGWLAAIWLTVSVVNVWPALFTAFQAAVAAAVGLGVVAILQGRAWYAALEHPWQDPWTWQAMGVALAGVCVAFAGVRRCWLGAVVDCAEPSPQPSPGVPGEGGRQGKRVLAAATALMRPAWPALDRILAGLLLAALLGISVWTTGPGIRTELGRPESLAAAIGVSPHAYGMGAWLLLAGVVMALAAGQWEYFNKWSLFGMVLGSACSVALVAARWQDENATASAMRWAAAAFLIITSMGLWFRGATLRAAAMLRWPGFERREPGLLRDMQALLLALTVPIILGLTIYPAMVLLSGEKIAGPVEQSLFIRMGSAASYLVPLVILLAVLIGHAVREQSPAFAFSGGLVLNLAVTLGYVLALTTAGIAIDAVQQIRLVQFNVIAAGAYALAWMGVMGGMRGRGSGSSLRSEPGVEVARQVPNGLLLVQVAMPLVAIFAVQCIADTALFLGPWKDPRLLAEVGSLWGWLAWGLAAAGAMWIMMQKQWPVIHCFAAALLVAGSMSAMSLCRGQVDGWLGYHALLAGRVIGAWGVLGMGWMLSARNSLRAMPFATPATFSSAEPIEAAPEWKKWIANWATVFGALTLALALGAATGDPSRPTWTLGGLLATSVLAVGLALWTLGRGWLYVAGILLGMSVALGEFTKSFFEMLQFNAMALACGGMGALFLELKVLRPARAEAVRRTLPPYHHFAAMASVVLMTGLAALDFLSRGSITPHEWARWATIGCVVALVGACLWDIEAWYPLKGLYVLGLVVAAMLMASLGWSVRDSLWRSGMILAGYGVLAGFLFTQRVALTQMAEGLGIPVRAHWPSEAPGWLAGVTLAQAGVVLLLALWGVLDFRELPIRLAIATAAIAAPVGVGLLAKDLGLCYLHRSALLLGVIGAVLWGWGWVEPGGHGNLLDRAAITMVATAALAALYAAGMVKILRQQNAWTEAAKELSPIIGGAMVAALLFTLGGEMLQADANGTGLAWWGIVAVIGAIVGLIAAAIVCAVVPGRDPLDLSERGRTGYVYAAEVLLVLLFVHLRLNFPEIFASGLWRQYWPFIIMMIAFAGVGLSELFRRQGRMVLAEPLEKTGAFLPVLPVIAYWAMRGTPAFSGDFSYAMVLFLAGLVYGGLSIARQSYGFGLVAALMANGGLWAVLAQMQGLGFFQHPQLWLVPAALSILVASYLNRDRLSVDQMRVIRYAALMIVYVSSTADIWVNGVKDAPWLPLVLAVFSVAGVMTGILVRVQSFLFLGTLFLVIAIVTMIQYAATQVGSNWPWMVAGIALGAGIVAIFAVFEKKREEMLAMVEGLKQWQR